MYKTELKEQLDKLVQGVIKENHAELISIELKPYKNNMLIRFLVDKAKGITVEECARLSRGIEERIEEEGMFSQGYTLEVASPGLDRLLRNQKDFNRLIGKTVVMTYDTGNNHIEKIEGVIESADEADIQINVSGKKQRIMYENIKKAKQKIEIQRGKKL
jgi:ribosome maturation factor RimP